jgi:ubiquinone/menaquinone biosynthesis C-methylase UbiE
VAIHLSSKAEVWDELAACYEGDHQDAVYWSCITQAIALLKPQGKVLDAGCGTGMATQFLLHCDRVEALDFSGGMLKELRKNLGWPDNLNTVQGDLRKLPFADASFDSVLCANALQHLTPDVQPKAAAELMRVLTVGGRYSVSVHHYSRYKERRHWVKEGMPFQQRAADYIFRFSRAELAALFPRASIRAAGFVNCPARLQNITAHTVGGIQSRMQSGHMLIAYGPRA